MCVCKFAIALLRFVLSLLSMACRGHGTGPDACPVPSAVRYAAHPSVFGVGIRYCTVPTHRVQAAETPRTGRQRGTGTLVPTPSGCTYLQLTMELVTTKYIAGVDAALAVGPSEGSRLHWQCQCPPPHPPHPLPISLHWQCYVWYYYVQVCAAQSAMAVLGPHTELAETGSRQAISAGPGSGPVVSGSALRLGDFDLSMPQVMGSLALQSASTISGAALANATVIVTLT